VTCCHLCTRNFITWNTSSHPTALISPPLCCRARTALRTNLPEVLRDGTFDSCLGVSLALDSLAASNWPLHHLHQIEGFSH
jgi:hypothetical protein